MFKFLKRPDPLKTASLTYTNWDRVGADDCAVINYNRINGIGFWASQSCYNANPYVCEFHQCTVVCSNFENVDTSSPLYTATFNTGISIKKNEDYSQLALIEHFVKVTLQCNCDFVDEINETAEFKIADSEKIVQVKSVGNLMARNVTSGLIVQN